MCQKNKGFVKVRRSSIILDGMKLATDEIGDRLGILRADLIFGSQLTISTSLHLIDLYSVENLKKIICLTFPFPFVY